jgi:hypothetical protein
MIFYNDRYYDELRDIIEDLELDELEIHELPEDYTLVAYETNLETIENIDADLIARGIDEDRFPEDNDRTYAQILKILNDNIDFEKINSLLPKLYYESGRKIIFTKADLIAEND